MIEVKNLVKRFGKFQALRDISFTVNNGEIVGFVGLNGAGKTTTVKITAGVLLPTAGDVIIDGYSIVTGKRKASKRIGWVPELPNFEQDVKALDYLLYISGYYGISSTEARRLAKELLAEVGLNGREKVKLKNYSQGMKKRFALAASLISNPDNFLFDEVLNGLDPAGIQFFKDLAIKLKNEKKALLFSSHILSEVENIADRVIFIHKGKIVGIKRMDELKKTISTKAVRIIVNNINEALKACESFGNPTIIGGEIIINDFSGSLSDLVKALEPYGVIEIGYVRQNLESIFFKIINDTDIEKNNS